ncbi:UTP--glucose-1-phosphate uridylyltransferase [Salsuginibacillus halophilus]|uniref:UTP--glucose-1-phosphate uridylyltransferase n=1 Tax=Salsuginibacillus halophilus TaxID=517424 RepID=A0A2P8HQR3_9BACI|nr:UTP--glucose-1-phosphate uridylyltransferase GalU [Salsuginibacillus halophilus]PSL48555.1 UTP--glucose-1-phosphate uridylyltransferase [Salsuginibacillus halophilus]
MNVKKAIIPAAGLGTRFLPATKAQPKEMLPVVDQPVIQYIVEEAAAAGIEDIMIISGRGKRAIEDHFDQSYELEAVLTKKQKWEQLEQVQAISALANIHYIRQREPKGLGHAIYCARRFIGDEPFAVLLGDDLVDAKTPCIGQLMHVYDAAKKPVIGVQQVDKAETGAYGIVAPGAPGPLPGTWCVNELVEKPAPAEAPSDLGIIGRYILEPSIFSHIANTPADAGGEVQLTDALAEANEATPILASSFQGERYDIGHHAGWLHASLAFALKRNEVNEADREKLRRLIDEDQK